MILEVGTTPGPAGRGLLGAMMAPDRDVPLPPLPPDKLAVLAGTLLKYWRAMKPAQRKADWGEFLGVRDKLLERMAEAPLPLRPPPGDHASPAFQGWLAGGPPNSDPFSTEYQDWLDGEQKPCRRLLVQGQGRVEEVRGRAGAQLAPVAMMRP